MGVLEIIWNYRAGFASGLAVTLQLSLVTWLVGLSLGTVVGAAAFLFRRAVGLPLGGVAIVLAGVPFLVLLYWANYPLQEILGVFIEPFYTALGLLCLINTVVVAETWRGALTDFPAEYVVSARVAGLRRVEILRYIQIPILFRQVLPGLIASQVAMLQLTLFASLISVEELFRVAQQINAAIQRPIEIYTALAAFFFILSAPLYVVAWQLRRRFTRNLSET